MPEQSILHTIAERTRERVAEAKAVRPLASVRAAAQDMLAQDCALCVAEDPTLSFEEQQAAKELAPCTFPFEAALSRPGVQFIAEVKKASPSKGLIAPDFPYLEIAKAYEQAGAAAISCLTEPYWFKGSDEYLRQIAKEVRIPVLRKDFVVDEYMIYEAKALGARAVLLICAILDDAQLAAYKQLADELRLSALVEAHTAEEVRRALAAGARIVGVNNRNLHTFDVDLAASAELRDMVPQGVLFVSESGIKTASDVQAARDLRTDAVLVGETLMRASDKAAKLAELRGDEKSGELR